MIPSFSMDRAERRRLVADHVRAVLELVGVDPACDGEVTDTPERVAELLLELTSGLGDPPAIESLGNAGGGTGLVIASDLEFHSICAHHLLPFFGRAHIGYVPGDAIVGIGALGRTLDHLVSPPAVAGATRRAGRRVSRTERRRRRRDRRPRSASTLHGDERRPQDGSDPLDGRSRRAAKRGPAARILRANRQARGGGPL